MNDEINLKDIDNNCQLHEREKWDKRDWAMTIGFLIIFPPIGLAALLRKLFYRRVWH